MKKVIFFVSKKVLCGEVACKYCLSTNFNGYDALKRHFVNECKVQQCKVDNCNCFHCDPNIELLENDGYNVYLNKYTLESYFIHGPLDFWGIVKPHYVLKDENETFIYEESVPASAA
jgi:hypothetical protein